MSVWKNLFTAVRGHVNDTAEAIQDTQLMTILDQQIREAQGALSDARDQRAKMVANRRLKEKSIEDLDKEIDRLMDGARKAKAQDKLDLAREAAERVVKLRQQRDSEQALLDQYKQSDEQMMGSIRQSEAKIENLRRQVESAKANEALIAAQRAASTTAVASDSKLSSAVDSLKRLEKRQAEQVALMEAADEMADEHSGADLDRRLSSLDAPSNSDVDSILKDL